jgi:uncharacterized NAD(P)/FAD-binding protein YdhS
MAVHFLRKGSAGLQIVLIDPTPVPGRGVAYGTQFDGHLLNVRAENMSAYPDAPDHFVKWARRNHSASVKADDFLPRRVYGQYVASQLEQASQSHPGKLRFLHGEAVALEHADGATEVRLASGQVVIADKVVLALGHFPPGELRLPEKIRCSSRYVPNPWLANAVVDAQRDRSVLLIGSGLTSVDLAVELRSCGFNGTIHMLSRRGLLPQSHKANAPFPPFWSDKSPRTVRGLLRLIRLQVKAAEGRGSDWRAVIDSLRPVTQEIWRTLPTAEQLRFLRHLRTYWDVHRHRIAEHIGDQLSRQLQSGLMQMHAGRITEYREDGAGVEVSYRDRKSGEVRRLLVDRVVNCTGPESDYRRVASPLLKDLMNKGLARPDELSLGLDASDDGALLDAQGVPSDFLYALGPLRKGKLWETIAVSELRVQVVELAKLLLGACQPEDVAVTAWAVGTERSNLQYH